MKETYTTKKIAIGDKVYEFNYSFKLHPRRESSNCKVKDVIEGAQCEIADTTNLTNPEILENFNFWFINEKGANGKPHYYSLLVPNL